MAIQYVMYSVKKRKRGGRGKGETSYPPALKRYRIYLQYRIMKTAEGISGIAMG